MKRMSLVGISLQLLQRDILVAIGG